MYVLHMPCLYVCIPTTQLSRCFTNFYAQLSFFVLIHLLYQISVVLQNVYLLFSSALGFLFADKMLQVIFDRLASIEKQQRVHTEILNSVLQAVTRRENVEACELPEDVVFPLQSLEDLRRLERKLDGGVELKAVLVRFGVNLFLSIC